MCLSLMLMLSGGVLAQKKPQPKKSNQKEPAVLFTIPAAFCISPDEMLLVTRINEFRSQAALPAIPLSKALCFVARTHADDLIKNKPGKCGLHSWSNKGEWKPICYATDANASQEMGKKPKELAGYPGLGYEITYWSDEKASSDDAMELWKSVEVSKNVFLNRDQWREKEWNAIGVCIREGYAIVWLGNVDDPLGKASVCGMKPEEKNTAPAGTPKTTSKEEAQKASNPYNLIVGSYPTKEEAQAKLKQVKKDGYPNAAIIPFSKGFRVSIQSFPTKEAAVKKRNELKIKYPGLWIDAATN